MNPKRRTGRSPKRKPGKASASSSAAGRASNHFRDSLPADEQQKQIQDLIDLLKRNRLAELEWESATFRVRLRHDLEWKAPATAAPDTTAHTAMIPSGSPHPLEASQPSHLVTITSPIVGTFYRSPSPDADAYVEESDFVKKGQVLCIVEAMKLMNEIESEVDGRIVKVLSESAKPVEYGQPLFLIDPTATP